MTTGGPRSSPSLSVEFFRSAYEGMPAWEIDAPQPAIVELSQAGRLAGNILDIGCGTGCNAIYLAEQGCMVTAFDLVPQAIERARARLGERPLPVQFLVASALRLPQWDQPFDAAIDAGVFHVFNDRDRHVYAENIHRSLKPGARLHLICFSEHQPGTDGPRRVTQQELRDVFTTGWQIESIVPAIYQTTKEFHGAAKAWLATMKVLSAGKKKTILLSSFFSSTLAHR